MSVPNEPMTTREKAIVAILAFLQFTIVVDFMLVAPLGALLLEELDIDAGRLALIMSAAAISAGVASFASASFADKVDRKKLLLSCYAGFLVGTALCGVAPSYEFLLFARIVTGVFGGVLGGTSLAVVADVFPPSMRGRVMGTIMTSLSAAQIAGLPAGLALSNAWGWQAPFLVIAGVGAVVGVGIAIVLPPLDAHLATTAPPGALAHALRTATKPAHLRVFATTLMLASGFMAAPLMSAFFVNNLRVGLDVLPLVYMITGACTFVAGPLAGKLADGIGKLPLFAVGTALCAGAYVALASLDGPTALWIVVVVNVCLYVANTARMIAAGALGSVVPAPSDRGAFMSINTSLQQVTGGVASLVGGLIVVVQADGTLARFDVLCLVVVAATLVPLLPMAMIDREVRRRG